MSKLHLLVFSLLTGLLFLGFHSKQASDQYPQHPAQDTIAPAFLKAKDFKGKTVVSTSGVISFTTGLENDYYLVDSNNKSVYFYAEAKLAKLINAPIKRTPLNISIVIDRSGSMQGVKMGYAKKAAKGLIDQMEATDFVSIVMYDNAIDSVQEPVAVTNKDIIKTKIDRITARGGTNLWGGTERGYDYVKKNYKPGFINRVLLITDGLANIGITDSSVIRQKVQKFREEDGISISTFGVGLDYNESLLTDMAETGTGNYYFIDNPDNMVSQFNKEMNGLLNVVAQAAELRIKIPEGVKVEKSYPLKFSIINDVLVVRLRDLFAEETKSTLFTLKIADHVNKSFKLSCTLSYTDVMDGKDKSVTNDNLLLPAKLPDPWLTHFNKNVIEQAILFTANENLELAMQEVDRGNFDRGGTILQGNNSYFRAARYYVNGNRSLQTMDSINRVYQVQASRAKFMNSDSLKKIQKFSKALNYQMRNKKQ